MAAAEFLRQPRLLVSGLSWATSDLRAEEEAISVKVPSAVRGQSREEVGKSGSGEVPVTQTSEPFEAPLHRNP